MSLHGEAHPGSEVAAASGEAGEMGAVSGHRREGGKRLDAELAHTRTAGLSSSSLRGWAVHLQPPATAERRLARHRHGRRAFFSARRLAPGSGRDPHMALLHICFSEAMSNARPALVSGSAESSDALDKPHARLFEGAGELRRKTATAAAAPPRCQLPHRELSSQA